MRSPVLGILAVLLGIFCTGTVLHAQRYGEWARPCDLVLSPRFSAPFNYGVYYQGHEFQTRWVSVDKTPPLESTEWYEAAPEPHPLSVDGGYRWDNAGVEVYCYVIRTPYFISYAGTPTGRYSGTVRRVDNGSSGCGGGGAGGGDTELVPITDAGYDPYDSAITMDSGSGGCGSGGDGGSGTQYEPGDSTGGETVDWGTGTGNGGTSVCGADAIVEYVCIDVWVEGSGWVEWGCGYVTTC
jgi:hypothetical protein